MAQDRDRQDKKSTTQGRPPLDAHERGTDNPENPRSISPAHWQGQPVPTSSNTQTSQPGFDRRGAGTARQFGRAGDYGQQKNQDEQRPQRGRIGGQRSEEHTSELQSRGHLVCRLLLEKKK